MVLTTALETHYPPDAKIHLLMLPAYCTVENSLGIDHLHENQNDQLLHHQVMLFQLAN